MARSIFVTTPVLTLYLDLEEDNVTTGAWTEITSAMLTPVSAIEIFNGSGSVIKLSTGATSAEDDAVVPYSVLPGKTSPLIPINIARGSRVSLQALDVDAVMGSFVINCFG